jgi:hypothetical protein
MRIFDIELALIEDVGPGDAMKISTEFSENHRFSDSSVVRPDIVLEWSEFRFPICSETVNLFPELDFYRS